MVPFNFNCARKIWPLLELLAKITRVLACSCSQKFCNCSHPFKNNLTSARARKNKHTARMLANARKDHSIPLLGEKTDLLDFVTRANL